MWKYKITIITFVLFMIVGNVMRLIPMSVSTGSLNLSEIVLYSVCCIIFLLAAKYRKYFPKELIIIYLFVFISFLIGSIRVESIAFIPLSYNVRILLYFISSFVIALAFYKIFDGNLIKLLNFYLTIFFINVIVAWAIYFIFPDAAQLWAFLAYYDLIYKGDPHIHRLLGTLFDPNFFGNILILPILISLYLFENLGRIRYLFLFLFFVYAEIFTFSRSSLLGLSIALMLYHFSAVKRLIFNFRLQKTLLINLFIFLLAMIGFFYLFPSEVSRFVERFTDLSDSASGSHRVHDLLLAMQLLSNMDIFFGGIGFNFFAYLELTKLSSIDSSIFSMLVTLGVLLFIFVSILLVNLFKKVVPYGMFEKQFYRQVFIYYIFTSLVICNFNNLLMYPFWIFSVMPILCFLYIQKKIGLVDAHSH